MQRFEFKVIPAPRKGEKARGAKTTEDRFAVALTTLMNAMARDGWDYHRADTLPCDERVGLTGSKTTFQTMLVFRRALASPEAAPGQEPAPRLMAADLFAPAPLPDAARLGAAIAEAGPAPALGPAADPRSA